MAQSTEIRSQIKDLMIEYIVNNFYVHLLIKIIIHMDPFSYINEIKLLTTLALGYLCYRKISLEDLNC